MDGEGFGIAILGNKIAGKQKEWRNIKVRKHGR